MTNRLLLWGGVAGSLVLTIGLLAGTIRAPEPVISTDRLSRSSGICSAPVQPAHLRPEQPYRLIRLAIFDYNFLPHPRTRVKKPKPPRNIRQAVQVREQLERYWLRMFRQCNFTPTQKEDWAFPVADPDARLRDNYRPGNFAHEAVDIFASHGTPIRAVVTGYVVEAGDDWVGKYRGGELIYRGGGLTPKAGNGVLLFDPATEGYFWYSHLMDDLQVQSGDFVQAGALIGRLGNTGNARRDGHGRHLHLAYKIPGQEGGIDGVLVGTNPYHFLQRAFQKMRK